ncbi:MAG: hypothetical protein DRI37_08275 [Chloroflexi bacterium]|nr:MAG: hypothetical protein DRI37_08275 [Chloroflexota bacterium]
MKTKYLLLSLALALGLLLLLSKLLAVPAPLRAAVDVHYVAPGGDCGEMTPCYADIQAAVDAATPGAEIRVAEGTYTGMSVRDSVTQVVYLSKTLTLRGGYTTTDWETSYPLTQPTILDAQRQGRVLYITGADNTLQIEGLRLTGGQANEGAGLALLESALTLTHNLIYSNTAASFGGGAKLSGHQVTLVGNDIFSNTATWGGGGLLIEGWANLYDNTIHHNGPIDGLCIWNGDVTLVNTLISNNHATGLTLIGGNLRAWHTTFAANDAYGLFVTNSGQTHGVATLTNTIIVSHAVGVKAVNFPGNWYTNAVTLTATLWGNLTNTTSAVPGAIITGTRNFTGDPAFADPAHGDYHLTAGSAARNRGASAGIVTDFEGDLRDPLPDLGADEYDAPGDIHSSYLPLVSCPPDPCRPIPGASYSSLSVVNPTNPDPETNPDYNLALLGYDLTDVDKVLVNYGPGDTDAPQFYYFFGDRRLPVFSNVYRVHGWDWEHMVPLPPPPMPWPVTAVGFEVAAGNEIIHTPDSGYDIGESYDALVLYASQTQITLKYTREDDIIDGYTVYVDGICVEPSLLALYEQLDASGRQNLPAVQGGQPLGRARNAEIVVSIRDKACPMDPRSRKDWWEWQ